jgi:hypothetical protein
MRISDRRRESSEHFHAASDPNENKMALVVGFVVGFTPGFFPLFHNRLPERGSRAATQLIEISRFSEVLLGEPEGIRTFAFGGGTSTLT